MSIYEPAFPAPTLVPGFPAGKVVIVHQGRRGARGPQGIPGLKGDPGDSIRMRGPWGPGLTYCALDAVSARSTMLLGVDSLYIQNSGLACSPSTVEPYLDPARWSEVGAVKMASYFGGLWTVYQALHGFQYVGQPVGYSFGANRWVLADSRTLHEIGVAVVREVVDENTVVLQGVGGIPNIDARVIAGGGDWTPGGIYYVGTDRGMLTLEPPDDPSYYVNPILLANDDTGEPGFANGVVLPWAPTGGSLSRAARQLVGYNRYYYSIVVNGQASVSGADDNSHVLAYEVSDETQVFRNGLNLFSGYTAADGTSISFSPVLAAGDKIEVWTPSEARIAVLKSTTVKVDDIGDQFDGAATTFVVSVGSVQVELQNAANLRLVLDATPQEPLVDYTLIEDPDHPNLCLLKMTAAPEPGTRFWALLMEAGEDGREIELQNDGTWISWRYVGSSTWIHIIALSDITGTNGQNFSVDAFGPLADRADYDSEPEGFSFLATDPDEGNIYFREATPGDWSDPVAFRGPPGADSTVPGPAGPTGPAIIPKGTLASTDDLDDVVDPEAGWAYAIAGDLWVYNGDDEEFVDMGPWRGPAGEGSPGDPGASLELRTTAEGIEQRLLTTPTPGDWEMLITWVELAEMLPSDDAGNALDFGTDALLYVSAAGGGGSTFLTMTELEDGAIAGTLTMGITYRITGTDLVATVLYGGATPFVVLVAGTTGSYLLIDILDGSGDPDLFVVVLDGSLGDEE